VSTSAISSSEGLTAGLIGVLLVVVVAWWVGGWWIHRRREEQRRASEAPSSDRLSRSSVAVVHEPLTFGGGSVTATVTNRRESVAYGYLGVVEEYRSGETNAVWSVLNLTLPGWVPYLVLDHRKAIGRPSVPPVGGQQIPTGDPVFDGHFVSVSADPAVVHRVLSPALRGLLVQFPLQRISLSGRTMLLRTFDDNPLSDTVWAGLNVAATEILSTAPSFVMAKRPSLGEVAALLPTGPEPLPEGFYGPEQVS
jgi:hypothetical protein